MSTRRGLPALVALLMLLATAAFAIGVTVEKSQVQSEGTEQTHSESEGLEEGSEAHEGEGDEATHAEEGSETVLGVDVESTPIIVLGAAVSLALVGVVLRWPRRETFGAGAVCCLVFAVLDGREIAHQLDEGAGEVATLATLALAFHLAAAGVAAMALIRSRGDRAQTTAA